jgi:hypothetical protein
MQRIDDMTGETIRLSSAQRDEQRQQTVALLMQVAQQTDVNTRGLIKVAEDLAEAFVQLQGIVARETAGIQRTFWQRLRWLVTGR